MARSTRGANPDLLRGFEAAQRELREQGIELSIHDAVRSVDEQAGLRARKGTMAARPGPHAPHVAGNALDLRSSAGMNNPQVRAILTKHGLHAPVKGEPWHWEVSPSVVITERGGDDTDAFLAAVKQKPAQDDTKAFLAAVKQPPKDDTKAFLSAVKPPAGGTKPLGTREVGLADLKGYGEAPLRGPLGLRQPPVKLEPGTIGYEEEKSAQLRARARRSPAQQAAVAPTGPGFEKEREAVRSETQRWVNRLGAPLYPVRDLLNKLAGEKGRLSKQYGGARNVPPEVEWQGIQRALRQWAPWESFKRGVMKGEATDVEVLQRLAAGDQELKGALNKIGGAPVGDFLLSFAVDAGTGRLQSLAAGPVAKLGVKAQAVAEAKIPALGKLAEGRRAYRAAATEYGVQGARAERFGRETADIAEDVKRTTAAQRKRGAKVRVKDPITGRAVNKVDALVADYVEAGAKGSRFEAPRAARPSRTAPLSAQRAAARAQRRKELPQIEAEAAAHGIDYAEVQRLGERYKAHSEAIGRELVATGALSPQAFERLRGFHLPRYYMLRATKPKEAAKLLSEMERKGMVGAEAAGDIRRSWDKVRRGENIIGEARQIETFRERIDPSVGRVAAPEATPAFARYTQNAQREIGEARAMESISQNADLAVPRAQATPEQLSQWKSVPGDGPLKDHLVHPGVASYIEQRQKALQQPDTWLGEQWVGANKIVRRWWMSAPRSAANNAGGNLGLANAALNVNGVERSLVRSAGGYASGMKELSQASKGKVSQMVREAWDDGVVSGETSILPQASKSFGSGFGVETLGEKLKAAPGQILRYEHPVQEWLQQRLLRDPEAGARFYLYKELRQAGKSRAEATRITHAAMIDYSAVGPAIRWAERNNIAPFVTFPLRAVFQYANLAARRPDVFQTLSGERLRVLADTLADERSGGKARARERRRKGEVSMFEFPLPGSSDELGQQAYLRAPILAPALQLFPQQPDASLLTGTLEERIKSAIPFYRVPLELVNNTSTYTGKPIVPPGLPPGSPDALIAQGMHLGRSIVPVVRDGEALYHALTGTQGRGSAFAEVPDWEDALLSFTLGVSVREGTGDTSRQSLERAASRMRDDEHKPYRRHAAEYQSALREGRVPVNEQLLEGLRKRPEKTHEVNKRLNEAVTRYKNLLTTSEFSGDDRSRRIEAQLQYIYALKQVLREAAGSDRAAGSLDTGR